MPTNLAIPTSPRWIDSQQICGNDHVSGRVKISLFFQRATFQMLFTSCKKSANHQIHKLPGSCSILGCLFCWKNDKEQTPTVAIGISSHKHNFPTTILSIGGTSCLRPGPTVFLRKQWTTTTCPMQVCLQKRACRKPPNCRFNGLN